MAEMSWYQDEHGVTHVVRSTPEPFAVLDAVTADSPEAARRLGVGRWTQGNGRPGWMVYVDGEPEGRPTGDGAACDKLRRLARRMSAGAATGDEPAGRPWVWKCRADELTAEIAWDRAYIEPAPAPAPERE